MTGVAFCNGFSGPYKLGGTELSFGMPESTRMACPEGTGPEMKYLAALGHVAGARIEDGRLILSNAEAQGLTKGDAQIRRVPPLVSVLRRPAL